MTKIYISIPIAGRENDVFKRVAKVENELQNMGYETYNPLEGNGQNKDNIGTHLEPDNVALFLGNDIYQLMKCDGIYMCEGWHNSKGCQLELKCAQLYGKKIMYELWMV